MPCHYATRSSPILDLTLTQVLLQHRISTIWFCSDKIFRLMMRNQLITTYFVDKHCAMIYHRMGMKFHYDQHERKRLKYIEYILEIIMVFSNP